MTTEPILLKQVEQGICTLTLNRPRQYNALSDALLQTLAEALEQISHDTHIKIVVIAAAGEAFCAGHDIKQMRADTEYHEHLTRFLRCSRVMRQIVDLPQPVIARVHGMATAAGCQLVATCDLAVASTTATFALSGIRYGLFCSTPVVALSRNVATKRALEMALTGEFISADEAVEYGLINYAVASTELDNKVAELVQKITRHPRRVANLGKSLFYEQRNLDLTMAYRKAAETIALNMTMPETIKGLDAFIDKRQPRWE